MSFCPGPCRRLERAKSLVHDGTGGMIVLLRLHCQSGFTAGAPAVSVARVNGSEARLSHDTREIALGGRLGSHCLERAQSRAVRTRQQQTCLSSGASGPATLLPTDRRSRATLIQEAPSSRAARACSPDAREFLLRGPSTAPPRPVAGLKDSAVGLVRIANSRPPRASTIKRLIAAPYPRCQARSNRRIGTGARDPPDRARVRLKTQSGVTDDQDDDRCRQE